MASYHLSVKTVQRSAGRSATAAAAYRHAERIACEREGRVHDYRAKAGVEHSFIVAPEVAPAWAQDRQALWNAAEARETRSNSVTAREWELALPAELDAEGRRLLVAGFAAELVARYGVAADVAIHAPHREGDQRNWHAHVLTTTRSLTAEGLTDKTRVLDAKQTGGPEIEHMRARWAEMQNLALERQGHATRVDHRSLAAQREEALAHGDELQAEALDRLAEAKLGPVVSAIERREALAAEREDRAYVPLTERGAQVHEARELRGLLQELWQIREALRRELQERVELARETYAQAREEGTNHVRAGLAALRAAVQRQEPAHEEAGSDILRERLCRVLGREAPQRVQDGPDAIRESLAAVLGRGRPDEVSARELDPIRQRLQAVLAREQRAVPVPEQEDPLALVVERLRKEPTDAPSFAAAREARAFRDEMERRFDRDTLARLGRGEEAMLLEIAGDRLDGLCLARAWLDSQGEPERSEARLSVINQISDAQIDAKRERYGHEREEGHTWGL